MAQLQSAHVYIHYFSNKNRYSTKLFLSEPNRQVSEHLGSIFGIIEINTPSRENSRIIEQLIAEIENTYYGFATTGTSAETAFEQTLKRVNDYAISLISKDPAYASGGLDRNSIKEKLNIAIGVIKDHTLLLTVVNTIGAYLIHKTKQEYKIIEIAKQPASLENHSLFDSVITGEISDSDYLFFCNNDLTNFISRERIVKTLTSLPPSKAADYFKHSLLQHEGFNFAGLIFQFESPSEEEGAMPESLTSIGALNASARATEKLLSPSLLPNVTHIMKRWKDSAQGFIKEQFPSKPSAPARREPSEPNFVKQAPQTHAEQPRPAKAPEQKNATVSKIQDGMKKSFRSAKQSINSNLSAIRLADRIKTAGAKMVDSINAIPNISKILIISFCVILGIFLTITLLPHTPYSFITGNGISDQLTQLEKTVNEAQSKLIYNDREGARVLIAQAQQTLQTIKIQNNNEQQFADALSSKIDKLVSQLRNITLVEQSTPITSAQGTITPDIRSLVLLDNTLVYFDNANKTATSIDVGSHAATPITGTFDGPVRVAKLDEHKTIFFLTESNHLYTIKGGKIQALTLQLAPDQTAVDFEFYNDRLYTLIPGKNQIYRHAAVEGGYGPGVTWLQQSGINIANAVSFKIDTSIWVLTSDGRLMNFFKGAQRAFAMAPIEPALTDANRIFKNPDQSKIFIFDQKNNRIVYIDTPAGNLLTQYYSPSLATITGITIDDLKKIAYVATGKDISAIPLPEPKPVQ